MTQLKVIYVSRNEFPDSRTGKLIQSLKVQYLSDSPIEESDSKGIPALTLPAEFDLFRKFTKVPAEYQLEFSTKPDNRGRPQLTIVDASLVSA